MDLIDTHCHIHSPEFFTAEQADIALHKAEANNVKTLLLVGTSIADSRDALHFAKRHTPQPYVAVGIHPHEGSALTESEATTALAELDILAKDPLVKAIGECGFDFYYNDRPTSLARQRQLLRGQLEIAKGHNLPLTFHVREAFADFWPIFDEFTKVTGVLHSFTDRPIQLEKALERGLYIGINGIATFTTHPWQKKLFKHIPLQRIVLETDAPFLTPVPKRGTINTPENVIYITKYLAELRGEDVESIARQTSTNARNLFGFS